MCDKICYRCGVEKEISNFSKDSSRKDGYTIDCKECRREISKKYRDENKSKISASNKKYRDNNKEYFKTYYKLNKEHLLNYNNLYKKNNNDKTRKYKEEYRKNNRGKIRLYQIKYRYYNKKYLSDMNKIYRMNNVDKIKKYINKDHKKLYYNKYIKNRKKTDPLFKLSCNLRSIISNSFRNKNNKKNYKTINIIGLDFLSFKKYIESKFEPWMNYENYGKYNGNFYYGWDIDHIIPISTAKTEQDIIRLSHYTNLQPLCSKVNRDIKRNN